MADTDLLRASEVQSEYGYSRSTLLRYENEGVLQPGRTPGGQRRYYRKDIENLVTQGEISDNLDESQYIYREFGASGANRWGEALWEEPLRALRGRNGRKLLREMRLNDPVIAAVFFAIENSMKQANWRVKAASESREDKEVADFIESCFYDMSFSWSDTLTFVFQCLEQGFSVLETVFKKRLGESPPEYVSDPASSKHNDGRIGWRKWAPRPADTLVDGNEFKFDDHGGIQGINQESDRWGKPRFIPIEKLLLFRTTVAPANNPFGVAIHRSMYSAWWFSQNIQEIEGIGLERDMAGLPVIYLGTDATMSGPNSDYELAKDLVRNIRNDEQAGVVIPKPKLGTGSEGRGILLELLASGGRRQYDTNAIIERWDKRKALAVLAQFIMLGMERVGSYALSQHQGDLFSISVTAWLNNIADVINQHAIPRLIKYNSFPESVGLPQLVPGALGVPDLTSLAEYINSLVQNDVIRPDAELERHLRQIGGFPIPKNLEGKQQSDGTLSAGERQDLPLEKSALLTRRVGLAVRSLLDSGTIDQMQAAAMMDPLVQELQAGINNEVGGGTVNRPTVKPPTLQERTEENGGEVPGDANKPPPSKKPPDRQE